MSDYTIRKMEPSEVTNFYELIEEDFLPGEYAPYNILHDQIQKGIQDGLVFRRNSIDCAYAICAANNESGFVLISLMAVFMEYRKRGIGTAFMESLRTLYGHTQGIIVEVERPEDAPMPEERNSRNHRIEFYNKLGFYLIPGIDYTIWDVPMHLMALPLQATSDTINAHIGEIMHQIYFRLMGKQFMHKMVLRILK
ncbi:MAG TPA: GNAT family N-acetyltransferase [Spirochaetota bacterium]